MFDFQPPPSRGNDSIRDHRRDELNPGANVIITDDLLEAIELALKVLESFRENSAYEDYQNEDGWTDEEYRSMLEAFREVRSPV